MSRRDTSPGPQIGIARRAGSFRIRRIDYPPGFRQEPHHHEHFGVTVVLSGRIRESTGRADEIGSPLSVVVKPAGLRHSNEIGSEGARTLQVAFGPEIVASQDAGVPLHRWRWTHAASAAGPLVRLAWLLRTGAASSDDLEEGVLEALAGIQVEETSQSDPPPWVQRVKEALDDRLTAGVTVQSLAAEAGVHPVSVSRAFRRHYGRSITEYRRLERLRRAAATIGSAPLSLSRIAHRTGYADQPHFCREFRRETGLTPSQFREIVD